MTAFPRSVERRMLLRSLLIQGSWNYQTLIGTGFAFSLLPLLRLLYAGDPQGLRGAAARHSAVFNSHPYLVTIALGAVARLEAERVDPAVTERFKSALRGSLGSLGDQLVWSAWRPTSLLLAIVLLLAGVAWWVGVLVFLAIYNVFHLGLRSWGLRVGSRSGIEVGRLLRESPLQEIASRVGDVGAFLCGAALVLAMAGSARSLQLLPLSLGAAGLGLWLGLSTRRVVAPLVGLVWLTAILWGILY